MLLRAGLELILDSCVAIQPLLEYTVDDCDVEVPGPCAEVIQPQFKTQHELFAAIPCGKDDAWRLRLLGFIYDCVD